MDADERDISERGVKTEGGHEPGSDEYHDQW
jgi:hypothetical protein